MATFRNDYSFGTQNEEPVRRKLETHFNRQLYTRGRYANFDFDDGSTLFVELKTRRAKHTAYPTSLIGGNKVAIAEANPNRTYYFCFHYEDGLFIIKYDKEKFNTYRKGLFKRSDRPDFHNQPQEVVYIPNNDLTCLSSLS